MNESFVPLNAAGASQSHSDFRVCVVSDPEKIRHFQRLGHGGSSAGAGNQPEPVVTLQRDGDRVSAIRIQCGCGQVIEVACVYQSSPEKDVQSK